MADESNTQSHQTGDAVEKADQVEVTDRGFYNHLVGKEKEVEAERNTQSHQTGEAVEKADQVEVADSGFYNHLVGKKEKKVEDERNTQSHQTGEAVEKSDHVEVTDRGFFNHLVGNKEKEVEDKKHQEPEKIKEKLPGGHKKPEDAPAVPVTHAAPAPVHAPAAEEMSSPDGEEKKGLLGKIMDKLPGYHKAAGEEDKAAAAAGEHKTSS